VAGARDTDRAAQDDAVESSVLARMSAKAREQILSRGTLIHLPSKAFFVRQGEAPRCGLLVKGLARRVRTSEDGRDLTLDFARPGSLLGLTATVVGPAAAGVQAVTDCVLLEVSVSLVRDLAMVDPTVGWAVAELLGVLLRKCVDELLLYAYGDLRTRIERRLLEFALKSPPATPLLAQLTQQDLAESVGAARPSVARVLKELRHEGAIRSMYGGVLILRPEALATEEPRSDVA
jgi:CRP/FNR family cyclic AMP-dependent transcriptional regulator